MVTLSLIALDAASRPLESAQSPPAKHEVPPLPRFLKRFAQRPRLTLPRSLFAFASQIPHCHVPFSYLLMSSPSPWAFFFFRWTYPFHFSRLLFFFPLLPSSLPPLCPWRSSISSDFLPLIDYLRSNALTTVPEELASLPSLELLDLRYLPIPLFPSHKQ